MIITDCDERKINDRFGPVEVMASPNITEADGVSPRYLTADYDLLMIGFHKGMENPHDPPEDIEFRDGVGQITSEQEALVGKLNAAVHATGYSGGNVVHHGPENQFEFSPYIDYPLTVFMPDDIPNGFFYGGSNGTILSIDMGEPGFRDINLKHFVNDMRNEGYDLYTNVKAPGWKWTWDEVRQAYLLEDEAGLPSYVEQLPYRSCDKYGYEVRATCHPVIRPVIPTEQPPLTGWLGLGRSPIQEWSLSPNPVATEDLTLAVLSSESTVLDIYVSDAFGNVRDVIHREIHSGETIVRIPTDGLESGVYTIQSKALGTARFVRL
jgi:hypothetical protein